MFKFEKQYENHKLQIIKKSPICELQNQDRLKCGQNVEMLQTKW